MPQANALTALAAAQEYQEMSRLIDMETVAGAAVAGVIAALMLAAGYVYLSAIADAVLK